jgi:argininosuccinate lyase
MQGFSRVESNVLSPEDRRRIWQYLSCTVAAHLIMMHDTQLIDDRAQAILFAALDAVRGSEPPDATLATLVAQFDERLDAVTPAGVAGTARVGRGVADVVATLIRLDLRDHLLATMTDLDQLREAAIQLAEAHVVTLMPAYAGGQATQPTTLGHFLGGLIAPLARAATRLRAAYDEVNYSPLGAGALASSGLGIDRERLASVLGFHGPVPNTFDAVAATDHIAATADALADAIAPGCRLIEELLSWLRSEPGSVRLADRWVASSPDLPHWRAPVGLQALLARGRKAQHDAGALRALAASAGYGPVAGWADPLIAATQSLFQDARSFLSDLRQLLSGMEINRANLANRAGRAYTTSSDLADVLMLEEQIDPGAARSIAALAIARVMQEGVEISALTPDIIDAAALVVLGRELKIEFEVISRYLAPRRFIERRSATGAPSPASTRAWLAAERERLLADRQWHAAATSRLAAALGGLEAAEREALDRAPSE